jgi:hypothetical protein
MQKKTNLIFKKTSKQQPKKNLVIVRAGSASLHKDYFHHDYPERSWDRMILTYVEPTQEDLNFCEFVVQGGLSKWTDLSDLLELGFFEEYSYEYIMIMDDDLLPNRASDFDILFNYAKAFNFSVCQPALSHDSFHSWEVTLRSPAFHVRYTNFVECMAPIFSKSGLYKLKPEIQIAISGCGLDLIFSECFDLSESNIGIVDDVWFKHTKPIDVDGGAFYKHLRLNGVDPVAETKEFLIRHQLKTKEIKTLGGVVKVKVLEI